MVIGFCGSGSMAAAMARGWAGDGDQMLFSDSGSGRARALAGELGGEAVANAEIAERADLVVVAVKPAKLDEVAPQLQAARSVVSILAAVPLRRVEEALPEAEVLRVMPNVGVEVRRGVLCVTGRASEASRAKLELLGHVVELPDADFDEATAVMGCTPAYLAVIVQNIAEAGAAEGLDPELAYELVLETFDGTIELLRRYDPIEVRASVASRGGATEAGLEALADGGVGDGVQAAVRASLERMRG
jgi:pyrroline-5-carboxylate reductase